MAQSPEYPDLKWVPPESWRNANRRSVQLIVIHTTEGHERATSAEDGAAYDARRTDGTSTHYFHDSNSTVQCVRTEDIAHTAREQGNERGIQHELCGRAGQSDDQWDDAASNGTIRQAARQAARDAKKWGIPVRRLTVAQVAAGVKGFCGHHDITRAFPQDNGSHTDPGPNFPWSQFLDMVRAELNGDIVEQADIDKIAAEVVSRLDTAPIRPNRTLGGTLDALASAMHDDVARFNNLAASLSGLGSAVQAIAASDAVDEQALADALAPAVASIVLANLPSGSDPVSQDEVNEAVKSAFRDAFATS